MIDKIKKWWITLGWVDRAMGCLLPIACVMFVLTGGILNKQCSTVNFDKMVERQEAQDLCEEISNSPEQYHDCMEREIDF